MRRVDYELPVPHEEEPEPEQEYHEPVEARQCYYPGKQTPLDHVEPMVYEI